MLLSPHGLCKNEEEELYRSSVSLRGGKLKLCTLTQPRSDANEKRRSRRAEAVWPRGGKHAPFLRRVGREFPSNSTPRLLACSEKRAKKKQHDAVSHRWRRLQHTPKNTGTEDIRQKKTERKKEEGSCPYMSLLLTDYSHNSLAPTWFHFNSYSKRVSPE